MSGPLRLQVTSSATEVHRHLCSGWHHLLGQVHVIPFEENQVLTVWGKTFYTDVGHLSGVDPMDWRFRQPQQCFHFCWNACTSQQSVMGYFAVKIEAGTLDFRVSTQISGFRWLTLGCWWLDFPFWPRSGLKQGLLNLVRSRAENAQEKHTNS